MELATESIKNKLNEFIEYNPGIGIECIINRYVGSWKIKMVSANPDVVYYNLFTNGVWYQAIYNQDAHKIESVDILYLNN